MASPSLPSVDHAQELMNHLHEEVVPVPPPGAAANDEEREEDKEKECLYKTKTIQFLGRPTPIVLQNDNGPCPLLAICNVLLLRNNLSLSPDIAEVSRERLLYLVAERLIDSNSNVNNKDAGYIQNQQQNVADAIDLLPRLATGIDVNIKFRRIDDFEFTPECAIFDLLDIPLYHGWLVDPQDWDTAKAIGSMSYNALMGELVALETRGMENRSKDDPEEDCIDFAAATTAALGVPSPSLSKARSFNDSPCSVSSLERVRKGDLEEEAELLRALKLAEVESLNLVAGSFVADANKEVVSIVSDERTCSRGGVVVDSVDRSEGSDFIDKSWNALINNASNAIEPSLEEMACSSSKTDLSNHQDQLSIADTGENFSCSSVSKITVEMAQTGGAMPISPATISSSMDRDAVVIPQLDEKSEKETALITDICKPLVISNGHSSPEVSGSLAPNIDSDLSSGLVQNIDAPETLSSSVDGSEPLYEGEECILDSATTVLEDREPMYEGEVILAKQADKIGSPPVDITPQEGELIKNFLKNNANQLTFYGLFCLQEGLKERELCIFFRNNHFSTMFKLDGQLYLLATDQGYINQPDLVWEKLNEVNGDTLFMTSNFKEFKVESHANDTWDENNAMATTADYLASIDSAAQAGLDINSDLQLAIALQQQEFEQQQPQRHNLQQQTVSGGSRLITGPQRPSMSERISASHLKPEPKSKDKCTVM